MSPTVLSAEVFFLLISLYLSFLSFLFCVWLFPGRKTPKYLLVVATHTELQRLKTALYKSKPSSFIPDRTIDPSTVQRGAERNNSIDDLP